VAAAPPPTQGKIASMASMFQGGEREVVSVPQTRHSYPGGLHRGGAPTGLGLDRPEKKVKVHRTESHHERFTSARAMFERIGSADNFL